MVWFTLDGLDDDHGWEVPGECSWTLLALSFCHWAQVRGHLGARDPGSSALSCHRAMGTDVPYGKDCPAHLLQTHQLSGQVHLCYQRRPVVATAWDQLAKQPPLSCLSSLGKVKKVEGEKWCPSSFCRTPSFLSECQLFNANYVLLWWFSTPLAWNWTRNWKPCSSLALTAFLQLRTNV